MNKVILKYLFLIILPLSLFISSCEEEGMTEKELREKIKETDFMVEVQGGGVTEIVRGAEVKLEQSGEILSAKTDSSGIVTFPEVDMGKAILSIQKEGYFEFNRQINLETNDREATATYIAKLYSREDAARIKGNVKIQKDLTTDSAEHPVGIKISAINEDEIISTTRTDQEGRFDLYIPTSDDGRKVRIKFPDLEYDQKIAVRKNDSTVVEKTAVGTIFNPYPEYGETDKVESTSNIGVEIVPPVNAWVEEYARQAYIKSLTVSSGSVTGVEIGYPGRGYEKGYTYHVVISSDSVSQWNEAEVEVEGTDDLNPYYTPLNPATVQINDPGNNYPEHKPNENVYTQPPKGFIWEDDYHVGNARLNNPNKLKAGEIYRIDANYGTGTERGDIQ